MRPGTAVPLFLGGFSAKSRTGTSTSLFSEYNLLGLFSIGESQITYTFFTTNFLFLRTVDQVTSTQDETSNALV